MTGDHAVTAQRADAASTARKRFAAGKTLDRSGKIRGPRKIKDFVGNMIKCDAFMYGR